MKDKFWGILEMKGENKKLGKKELKKLETIEEAKEYSAKLKEFCSRRTCDPTYKANWTDENAFCGHSKIIALLIQERFGGQVCMGHVEETGETHYWNEIDGKEYDFTKEQFTTPVHITFESNLTKEDMLKSKEFQIRYINFRSLVHKFQ